jgi:hypothetical protein
LIKSPDKKILNGIVTPREVLSPMMKNLYQNHIAIASDNQVFQK